MKKKKKRTPAIAPSLAIAAPVADVAIRVTPADVADVVAQAKAPLGKARLELAPLPKTGATWVRSLFVHDWRTVAVGTRVLVLANDAEIVETQTRGVPRDFGGQPVVDLEGFEGPYCMRNVYVRGKLR